MTSQQRGETPPPDLSRKMGRHMIWLAWLVVLAGLTWFFADWLEGERNPNRDLASVVAEGGDTVLLRNRAGHYLATGAINGQPVTFLLDTGASDVNVPGELARSLGLAPGRPLRARTANGVVTVYATRLREVRLGSIRIADVAASINPHMPGQEVLLGMSFLRHLDMVQRGDTLTLRAPGQPGD